jgi:hypothetical protein
MLMDKQMERENVQIFKNSMKDPARMTGLLEI